MKVRVRIDTNTDVLGFVNAVQDIDKEVFLKDSRHFCVSAHSLLGAMCSIEWEEVLVDCEEDIYSRIMKWVY